ncbi:MAG: FGGY-family carbohydrate kinase [Pseudomonadota bacterium]
MTLALGIDVGTSGVRTAVLDADGQVISTARADHLRQPSDQFDANLWWDAVQTCIQRQVTALDAQGHSGAEITRIAVDGTSGTMVITDSNLNPVTPALMYNSSGFTAEAARIDQLAPPVHITRGTNSALARAMRLAGQARGRHLLHQADFVAAKLTGRGGLSDHNNALKTGFDPATGRWPDWAAELIDPTLLPDPRPVGDVFDQITPAVATGLGLSPDAVVCAGTTDSIAAFMACAPLAERTAVTSLGSTLAIKMLSPTRIDDPSIGLYAHRLGDHWLVGGASNTGGAVLAAHFTSEDLKTLSGKIDPEQRSSLDYYPLLKPGERFPINDPDLLPRLTPRPANDVNFLHGLLDGIARIEALCYQEIEGRGGGKPAQIFTAGGGSQNPTWTKIRAHRLGFTPQVSAETEASVGAARVAQMHAV